MFALKGKNQSIELIRIVACLLVIMAHSQFAVVGTNGIVYGLLGMSTMVADDVPLFLLVTGFFFFGRVKSDQDVCGAFAYKAKSFLGNLYIPTLLYILISIFYRYYTTPTLTSLADADWNYLGRFIFRLAPGDHLWYICTYMSFVFFFPMLAFLCQDIPERNKMRRILLGVAVAGTIVIDVQYILRMYMFDIEKFLWGYCTIFLILGYELSLFVKKHGANRLKLALLGLGLYVVSFALKYGLQIYMYNQFQEVNCRFRWLQCTPCFISAVGLFLLIYSLGTLVKKDGKLAYVISFIGSCTFAIYLFHQIVIKATQTWRFQLSAHFGYVQTLPGALGYYFSYAAIVFLITFAVGFVFKFLTDNSIGRLFKKKN